MPPLEEDPAEESEPTVEQSPLEEPTKVWLQDGISGVDTSNWDTYRNNEYGFEFKFPESWTVENTFDHIGSDEFVAIRDEYYGVLTGDLRGAIYFPTDIDSAIDRIGSQFTNRSVIHEEIILNGVPSLLVTVNTLEIPGWKSTVVFVLGRGHIYEIHGDLEDQTFLAILGTFKLLPQKE